MLNIFLIILTLVGSYNIQFQGDWTPLEKLIVINAVDDVVTKLSTYTNQPEEETFNSIFKKLKFIKIETGDRGAASLGKDTIIIFGFFPEWSNKSYEKNIHLIVHELGHTFDHLIDNQGRKDLAYTQMKNYYFPDREYNKDNKVENKNWGFYGLRWLWQLSDSPSAGEEFADMFLGFTYNKWDSSRSGLERRLYMNYYMSKYIKELTK